MSVAILAQALTQAFQRRKAVELPRCIILRQCNPMIKGSVHGYPNRAVEADVHEARRGAMLVNVFIGKHNVEVLVDVSDKKYTIGDLKCHVAQNIGKPGFLMDLMLQPKRQAMANDDIVLADLDLRGPLNRLCFSAKASKAQYDLKGCSPKHSNLAGRSSEDNSSEVQEAEARPSEEQSTLAGRSSEEHLSEGHSSEGETPGP